jgi:hypothetical protein
MRWRRLRAATPGILEIPEILENRFGDEAMPLD